MGYFFLHDDHAQIFSRERFLFSLVLILIKCVQAQYSSFHKDFIRNCLVLSTIILVVLYLNNFYYMHL